ncbi:hypothetical protein [Streptomyces sp. NPDC014623]|uniref:hypothetical protein n=1 Tax=Streptomyces sp. NPDC014623 TaxID=3364875 RepID=UPI00370306AD
MVTVQHDRFRGLDRVGQDPGTYGRGPLSPAGTGAGTRRPRATSASTTPCSSTTGGRASSGSRDQDR